MSNPQQPSMRCPLAGRFALTAFRFSLVLVVAELPSWAQSPTGFELLGRGVNYGNMLEAPREGDWGVRFQDEYPRLIKAAGFNSVRLPVCWSAHTAKSTPFAVEPDFLRRVKSIVDLNLAHGLKVVLNIHHFDELYANPAAERDRFLAVWRQIAEYFQSADERVFFEVLNEPHGELTGEQWNALLADAVSEIRKRHPTRWIIVGTDQWNSFRGLSNLKLPDIDRRLIVTVHYYLPFAFTHQGASWARPTPPVGKTWTASPQEIAEIERDFAAATNWAKEHGRPIYLGEFGAYSRADMDSRVRWTGQVRKICEAAGFGWAYWELAAGFGILDPTTRQWREPLVKALLE
jgi:endoglucanase